MQLPADQRRALAAFLRARREALNPATLLGAAQQGRRRTPGLRREEVAQRSGLSTTWYTWVEQAREIALSPSALARLADALHLTTAERAYMFALTRRRDPAPQDAAESTPPAALQAALHSMTGPAYLLDHLWQARAWNDGAARLFTGWLGGAETNLLRYIFLDPSARDFICDWENRARRVLAEFRADTARAPDDPAIQDLVTGLKQSSPVFTQLWNNHAVLGREGGTRMFNHPSDGMLQYEQISLVPAGHPELKLVMLLRAAAA